MAKLQMLQPRLGVSPISNIKTQSSTGWVGSENSTRMYDRHWRRVREQFLLKNPLCAHCLENKIVTPANEVDHIIPHRGDKEIFDRPDNLQSLCKSCHSRKTARENYL